MQHQSWSKIGLLVGALVLPGCTLKDTSNDKPAGSNTTDGRESAPPAGTPDNPSNQQPQPDPN